MSQQHTNREPEANQLVRQLGLFDSSMMIIGIVVGSGIFLTTGIMARHLPSAGLILLAWLVGGLLALAGALTLAELGVAMPEAGGQYVYLREAYGPLAGFLFGWVFFAVYQTAAMAAIATAFAEYFGYFLPGLAVDNFLFSISIDPAGVQIPVAVSAGQLVAVALIILLSALNIVGVSYGKWVQNFVTLVKIGTLVCFIIFGLTLGNTGKLDLDLNPGTLGFGQLLTGFGLALIAASWAYNGWNYINFVAGEIRDPARNLPRALIQATFGITLLYLLINLVYLLALPVERLAGVVAVAEETAAVLFAGAVTAAVSAAVAVATLGGLNGTIFSGARVFYAMARDGVFFRKMGIVHPRFRTPAAAIVAQAALASIYTLSGTFERLITYAMVVTLLFWITTTASVFTLRRKYPLLPRPYKTWGYPWVPLIFILASAGILVNTLIEKPLESIIGIGLTLMGMPVYLFWRHRYRRPRQ